MSKKPCPVFIDDVYHHTNVHCNGNCGLEHRYPDLSKTVVCPYGLECQDNKCKHAHNVDEFRCHHYAKYNTKNQVSNEYPCGDKLCRLDEKQHTFFWFDEKKKKPSHGYFKES